MSAPGTPDPAVRAEVLGTLNTFMRALRTRDTTTMLQLLDSASRMTLLRPVPGGGIRVVVLTGAQFVRVASNPNQAPIDEPIRNAVVHVDGPLASVWAEYQVRRADKTVSHCGYDAFHLAKLGERWKILNVSDSFRQTGCGPAWPE